MRTPSQVVIGSAAALNRRDTAGVGALYHENATNIQIAEGEPIRRRQAMPGSLTRFV